MFTGYFKNLLVFTLIILIHELGHLIVAVIFKWKIDKIYIYPFGGCTKFIDCINKPLVEELLILISGPIVQVISFLFLKNYLYGYILKLFINYNYSILFFNLLPIYPLDGGKLLNVILSYKLPYKYSLKYSISISFIILLIILFKSNGIIYYLIMLLLFFKIIEQNNNIEYYYNKFLLERYLYRINFHKIKIINNIDKMMRNKRHIIKYCGKYETEKSILNKKYKK